jgi:hypothetical protein
MSNGRIGLSQHSRRNSLMKSMARILLSMILCTLIDGSVDCGAAGNSSLRFS